jgi:hypothetical protein
VDEEGRLYAESDVRETRRMRARRVARGGETVSQVSVNVAECEAGTRELGDVNTRLRERKVGRELAARSLSGLMPCTQNECGGPQTRASVEGCGDEDEDESMWMPTVEAYYPTENGKEIDEDHKEDDQLRATLRAVNEMVYAILSWD